MTAAGIAHRRLASQDIAVRGDDPAEVVRRLIAVQSQDYRQSLWAVGSRLRRGTLAQVEDAIAGRQIVRTWLMRGTVHLVAAEDVLADLAARFIASRGPVTDHDLARWAGITLGDARRGIEAAGVAIAARTLDGVECWVATNRAAAPVPRAGRKKAFLLAGFDEYILGYRDRDSQLAPEHAAKVGPGANGIFKPVIVVDGQVVGTWARAARANGLAVTLQPFAAVADLADLVQNNVHRYRDFLGLPASCEPVVVVEAPGAAA